MDDVKNLNWLGRNSNIRPKTLKRRRKSDDGLYAWCIALALLAFLFMAGCAPVHDPQYDGDAVIPVTERADTVVRVQIVNARTTDALDPSFYIKGFGTHNLGVVKGFGGKLDRVIPKDWLGPNNCATVIAHYPGGPDLVYEEFCWRSGEYIDVRLDDIWVPGASWSHR